MTATFHLSPAEVVIAVVVAAVGSAINAVAGGGSLISFPVLTAGFGMDSVVANATNTVSLWPGSISGALGFINLFKKTGHHLRVLFLPTLIGSACGAMLLLSTSAKVFDYVIPGLILFAALMLALQKRIKQWTVSNNRKVSPFAGAVMQFLVSVYGGYFGAGMGIMMLAAMSLYVEGDIHEHNALKNWLGMLINLTATIPFVLSGKVAMAVAAPLIVGSVFGGFAGARMSQRVNADKLRLVIATYGFMAAAYFAYRAFA